MAKVKVFDIDYDTDGMRVKLPKTLIIDVDDDDIEDFDLVGADYISDITGWCVFSFNYKVL